MRALSLWSLVCLGALAACAACAEPTTFTPEPPTLPAPRLPMNNAYLGSVHDGRPLRPTFIWEPSTTNAAGTLIYELQLSQDKAFEGEVLTFTTEDTSYQAPELPVSLTPPVGARYFWRLRACIRNSCSVYTRPWYVNLGRAIKDYNGDGYSDVAVGAPGNDSYFTNAGRVLVYFGGPSGPRDVPDRLMGTYSELTTNGAAGRTIQAAGDVNGDGFADLLWAIPPEDVVGAVGRASLFLGGAGEEFDGVYDTRFATGIANDGFAVDGGGLGDVNGDGFDDLFIATSARSDARVEVYFGEPGKGVNAKADGVLPPGSVSGGDMNGDGLADVLIGNAGDDTGGESAGAAYVFLGAEGGQLPAERAATFVGRGAEDFGIEVSFVGDVDRDGFGDVVVGNLKNGDTGGGSPGSAYLFVGGRVIDESPMRTWKGKVANDSFGTSTVGAGDVNGDGYSDVLVAAYESLPGGAAYLFLGGPRENLEQSASLTLLGASENSLGSAVSGTGDVNGDGFADFVVGASGHSSYAGRADVFFGRERGLSAPDVVLHGAADDYFGTGLAFSRTPREATAVTAARRSSPRHRPRAR